MIYWIIGIVIGIALMIVCVILYSVRHLKDFDKDLNW